MKLLCDTMRRQILSRAFYGWLAYCRHLKTVKLHLVDLVHPQNRIELQDIDFSTQKMLTKDTWLSWLADVKENGTKLSTYENVFYQLVYQGGVEHEIRKEVWPFLLKHYTFEMDAETRIEVDNSAQISYENIIEEWKVFEKVIRAKDSHAKHSASEEPKEEHARIDSLSEDRISNDINLAKNIDLTPMITKKKETSTHKNSLMLLRKDSSLSNDVFMDDVAKCASSSIDTPIEKVLIYIK